jgi:hypothetical protein
MFLSAYSHPRCRKSSLRKWNEAEYAIDLPVFPKRMFPSFFDLSNPFHSLEGRLHQFSVVAHRNISALFKVDRRILGQLV